MFFLFEDLNVSFLKILSLLINLIKIFFTNNIKLSFTSNLLDLSQILSYV